MGQKPLKFARAAVFFLAAACGGETGPQSGQAGPGWSIVPEAGLNEFFECLEAEGKTLVSAHRGGPADGLPENAIETMNALLSRVPAIMEVDVAASRDGVLYLMHDETLGRTTNAQGPADELNWADIEKLRLTDQRGEKTAFSPPSLDEVLAWAKGRTILQLDIKRSARYEDVAAALSRQNAHGRIILIAYTLAQARKLHALMPDAMISLNLNSQSELNRAVAAGIEDTRLIGFTGAQSPRPRLFSVLNNRDVEVMFATLGGAGSMDAKIEQSGDLARYGSIARMGVDIIATDRPDAAHNALSSRGLAPVSGQCGIVKTP